MEQYMWIVWLSVFALALLVEAGTTELVSLFFGIGALVTLIISFIPGASWWIQLIVFVVVSGVSLIGLRPLVKRYLSKQKRNTNVDELIGKRFTVIDINGDDIPEVKVNGLIWRAVNVNEDEKLNKNDKIEVVAINGNKLVVRKVEK